MKYSSFLAAMVLPTAVMASPCEYDRDVESIHTKVIESTRITDKSIRMMTDKTMQCTVPDRDWETTVLHGVSSH